MHHDVTSRPATTDGGDRLLRRIVIGLLFAAAIVVGTIGPGEATEVAEATVDAAPSAVTTTEQAQPPAPSVP